MSETHERSHARLLGVVYLLYFLAAVSGGLLVKGLKIPSDAVATAQNFTAHPVAVTASSALGVVSILLYLALTALSYELFRPVSRHLTLLATVVSITACAIQGVSGVFLSSLQVLAAAHGTLRLDQISQLAQFSSAMQTQALTTALAFFGVFDLIIGILILRSGIMPRIFGVLMALAGLGWLTYLWPPLAARLSGWIQPLGFVAEAVLMIWLLLKGVDEDRWRRQTTHGRHDLDGRVQESSRPPAFPN